MATGKRRLIVKEDLNLGDGFTTIQTDSGGTRTASKIGIQTFLGDGYVSASNFPGVDASESIHAALLALPATGGIVDARGFTGDQVFSTNPFQDIAIPFTLLLGNATFSVLVSMQISALDNCHIVGTSGSGRVNNGTIFQWDGLTGSSILIFDRVQASTLDCLDFISGSHVAGVGWQLDQLVPASGGLASASNIGRTLTFSGVTTGIQIGNTAITNNSSHSFYDVTIESATYGYWLNNAQSSGTLIVGGAIEECTYGIFQNDGGFTVHGTRFAGSMTCDIFLNTASSAVCIDSVRSVSSPQFIGTNLGIPSALVGNAVTVIGCTYCSLLIPSGASAIDFSFAGALNLFGNNFAANIDGGGSGKHITGVYTVHAESANVTLNTIGNTYPNGNPFLGTMKRVGVGDRYTDNSDLSQLLGADLNCNNTTALTTLNVSGLTTLQDVTILGTQTGGGGGGGGGGSVGGTGTTNKVAKWTSSSAIGDSQITDDGTFVSFLALPFVTHNAILFANTLKQIATDEGDLNWDSTNKNLSVGFGPMTDYSFGLSGGIFTTGAGGVILATANSNASTLESHIVAGTATSIRSEKTGSGTRLPMTLLTGGHETLKLTTDPFVQITTSYGGGNLSAAGTVALRNNAGALESSQNGGAWTAVAAGGGGAGSGTTGFVPKWTDGAGGILGNSSIADDGSDVTIGDLPSITHNAIIFGNSSKKIKTDEGNLNWDSTNKNLNIGFGPMTDYSFGLAGGLFTTGAGGVVVSTANSNASTLELHAVSGNSVSMRSEKTGSGTRLPMTLLTGGNETLRLTTDPFVQITTSYTGSNLSASGAVALRNNAGALQVSQNAGAWTAIGTGTVTGTGTALRVPLWTSSTGQTNSSIIDNSGAISGPGSIALGPGTLPASTIFYGSSDSGSLYIVSYASSDAGSAALSFRKSRGVHTAPADAQDGDAIGAVTSNAYSAGFLGTAKITFRVSGLGSSGQRPGSKIEFATNVANGGVTIGMVLQNNQVLTLPTYGAGTATFDASGNLSSVSDENLKNIQGTFDAGLAEVINLIPIRYKWNEESGLEQEHEYAGFSAQNVQTYIPLAVGQDANGHLTLQDRALLAAQNNAIKELNAKVEMLMKRLSDLEQI